jgi:hypothetical protein
MAAHLRIGSVVTYGGTPGVKVTNITNQYLEVEFPPASGNPNSEVRVIPWAVQTGYIVVTQD